MCCLGLAGVLIMKPIKPRIITITIITKPHLRTMCVLKQPTVTLLPVMCEESDKRAQLDVTKQTNRLTQAISFQMSDNSLSHGKF